MDNDSFSIRLATTEDQNTIVGLYTSFMDEMQIENPHTDFSSYKVNALRKELTQLDNYYLNKLGNAFFVAQISKKVVGSVGFEKKTETTAEIRRLLVSDQHRNNGIATLLMHTAEEKCREYGYSQIILETSEYQPASISLYEKLKYDRSDELVTNTEAHKGVAGIKRFRFNKNIA